jgi:hypothetical protein
MGLVNAAGFPSPADKTPKPTKAPKAAKPETVEPVVDEIVEDGE